jgi:glycosyltransferase involved in cell wall biosynthesis
MHNDCSNPDSVPLECPWRNTCPTPNAKCELSGNEGLSHQLLNGWHKEDAGQSLWSTQSALMIIRNPPLRARISMSGILPPSLHDVKNTLHIYCNGCRLGTIVNYSDKPLHFSFKKLISCSSDEFLHLKFHVSDLYCPSENEISTDKRSLGFALFHVLAARPRSVIKSVLADLVRHIRPVCHIRAVCVDWLARIIARRIQSSRSSVQRFKLDSTSGDASGLSVVVIDNGEAGALARCMSGICSSVEKIDEPIEIAVVSTTFPEEAFRSLPSRLSPRWIEVQNNRAFADAFRTGIAQATHKWVYVVGSQNSPDESTLLELLKWRAPHVFAIGSKLHGSRNWMGIKLKHGLVEPEYREPDTKTIARGAVGVSPECSLYNRALLQQLWGHRDVYSSPDWENLEWGIRSWRMGCETILDPASRVYGHQAPAERAGCTEVDALRFLLRNAFPNAGNPERTIYKILHAGLKPCADLLNPAALASHRVSRSLEHDFLFDKTLLDSVSGIYYINPDKTKPPLIFASPYALFPPSHGSAVGMFYYLRALMRVFSIHILSDEAEAYTSESLPYFEPFATVRLLSGRKEDPGKLHDRIARIESHSRPAMREALRMMISVYQPRFVEIEHIELAKLIEAKGGSPAKWILNLHDVFLSDAAPGASAEDRYELDLIHRFDSLICYSSEDASLLGKIDITVVPNAVELADYNYEPSPAIPRILFIGPWRSPQNLPGILEFLEHVYPVLLPRFANLELWYLGGKGVHEFSDRDPRFRQRGIEIIEYVDDVQEILKQCALTINPISGNRGSCRKVVESLAAGRVCVSTRAGARGYLELEIPSLLACESLQDFAALMIPLLEDIGYRRKLERLDDGQRHKLSWEYSQKKLLTLFTALEARQHR